MDKNLIKFDDLYESAISHWPSVIHIQSRKLHNNGGATFIELNKLHDKIEENIMKTKNDLLRFMDWAIFAQVHNAAKYLDYVHPSDLNKEVVRKKFEEDLFDTTELSEIISEYKRANE